MQKTGGAILITGGTGTLGAALTRALCQENRQVVAHFWHDEKRAAQLQNETGCTLQRAEISDENAVRQMFAALPPLFAVIHAAGIARDALLLRQSPQSWHETMNVNLTGAFLVAREALQTIENGGRLLFFASRVGERGAAGQVAYAASKAATIALMRCAARESAERLSVNAICPPFVPSALAETLNEGAFSALQTQSLSGHFGETASLMGAVRWLLGEEGKRVSGQVIHCDDRIF